jgi:PAS domain S-box-containing protein
VISASSVLAALGDGVITLDRDARVIVWTPAAERFLGHPAEEVVGGPLPDVGIRLEVLPIGRQRRLRLRRRDGSQFPATVMLTPLHGPDGGTEGAVLVIKDLTVWIGGSEVAADDEGADFEVRLGAAFRGIVETTADLERAGRPEALAQSLAEQARRLLPGISCLVSMVPADRQDFLSCVAGAGPLAEQLVGRTLPRQGTVLGVALEENRVLECTSMREEGMLASLFAEYGIDTMRAVPIGTEQPLPDGRRSLGAVVFFRAACGPFTAEERRLLDEFGALAGITLQRAEFRAASERSMQRLQLAVEVALDLARSLDVGEVVRRLVRRAALATEADRCMLLRLEGGKEGEAVVVDAYDAAGLERGIGHRQPVASLELVQEALVSQAPALGGRFSTEGMPGELRRALHGVRHTVAVPLVQGGEVMAVLVLCRRQRPPFSPDDVQTLVQLGGPAALALHNSYLYSRTEEAGRFKTEFLDMAAHELRTPLTVISGYLSVLRDGTYGPPPPNWAAYLQILEAKAAELRRLVDDLLLAARLDTGRLTSRMEPHDLREVVREGIASVAAEPELELPDEPVPVRCDREQLSRVVAHLVVNAFRYVRDGTPPWARVRLELERELGRAKLVVEDRGRGMPPGAERTIFERFTRLEDPEQPSAPGTGLGLYIGRELTARHGGTLLLEWSQAGEGSRFALYLPLRAEVGTRTETPAALGAS